MGSSSTASGCTITILIVLMNLHNNFRFPAPPNSDYTGYHKYVDKHLPQESPHLYGLHPNAEIGFLTATSEKLFKTVFELQSRESGGGGSSSSSQEVKVKTIVDDIIDKMPEQFNMVEMLAKCEDRNPYIVVCFQVPPSYFMLDSICNVSRRVSE